MLLVLGVLLSTALLVIRHQQQQQQRQEQRQRRQQRQCRYDGEPPLPSVPVFFTAGVTAETQRAAYSTLKDTLDQYRSELGLRMNALHNMTYVRLPEWEEKEDDEENEKEEKDKDKEEEEEEERHDIPQSKTGANLTAHLQARMWRDFEKIPACWQRNEDLLTLLLRIPNPTLALLPAAQGTPKHRSRQRQERQSTSRTPTSSSYNDAIQILTHLYRDWTDDGQDLRRKTYTPILRAAARLFQPPSPSTAHTDKMADKIEEKHILVPGAGLGRLAFELAFGQRLSQQQQQQQQQQPYFHVTAMDISPVMIAATAAVLDMVFTTASKTKEEEEGEKGRDGGKEGANLFYPFLHDPLLNQRSHARRFHAVSFPDTAAVNQLQSHRTIATTRYHAFSSSSASPASSSLALELGNFLHLPLHPSSSWSHSQHAIITCFFLDTTPNPLSYLRTIHSLLQEGGFWINLGPLNYHTTLPNGAVQLTMEEIEIAAEGMGFRRVKEGEDEDEEDGELEGCGYRPEPPRVGGRAGEGERGREERSAFLRVDVYQPVMRIYQRIKRGSDCPKSDK
eukprot:evm.model.NODE_35244_length_30808_cov_23.771132.4